MREEGGMDDDEEVLTVMNCEKCGGTYTVHADGTPGIACRCLEKVLNATRLQGKLSERKHPFVGQ